MQACQRTDGLRLRFQFHYGSIKIKKCRIWRGFVGCFNSTMVRLKSFSVSTVPPYYACFNSTMVRLKCDEWEVYIHVWMFQFHYGSIKIILIVAIAALIASFNSTMVRLKLQFCIIKSLLGVKFQFHYGSIKIAGECVAVGVDKLFQFHYGSIKIVDLDVFRLDYQRFNSTMVRLKYWASTVSVSLYSSFQFHYGSIKMGSQTNRTTRL